VYAEVFDNIASARVEQDESIQKQYLYPWQTTLSTSINVAMKARQSVRVSRLELDAAKQTSVFSQSLSLEVLTYFGYSLKSTSPVKQEQARLDVENAEDDLVQKTEVAITLMKTVLENVCQNHSLSLRADLLFAARTLEESQRTCKGSGICCIKKKNRSGLMFSSCFITQQPLKPSLQHREKLKSLVLPQRENTGNIFPLYQYHRSYLA